MVGMVIRIMYGIYPKHFLWWKNEWWMKPEYLEIYGEQRIRRSVEIVSGVFDEDWLNNYEKMVKKEADRIIREISEEKGREHLQKIWGFAEVSKNRLSNLRRYTNILGHYHDFMKDFRGEGTYVLNRFVDMADAIDSAKGYKAFREFKNRLRRREYFHPTLAELDMLRMAKEVGCNVRTKNPVNMGRNDFDLLLKKDGESLAVEVTRVAKIEASAKLDHIVDIIHSVLFEFFNESGYDEIEVTINDGILQMPGNGRLELFSIEMGRKIKEEIVHHMKKNPRTGRFRIPGIARIKYEKNCSYGFCTVTRDYNGRIESQIIHNRIKKKRAQIPPRTDSVFLISVPYTLFIIRDRFEIEFMEYKNSRLLGIVLCSKCHRPGQGLSTEYAFVANPFASGNPDNGILSRVLDSQNWKRVRTS